MGRKVTQRELRNESGEIMRGLDRGESYIVTRNGVPVGELRPLRPKLTVTKRDLLDLFGGAPAVDVEAFMRDVRRDPTDSDVELDPWERFEQPARAVDEAESDGT